MFRFWHLMHDRGQLLVFSSDLVARPGSRWLCHHHSWIKNQGVEKLFGELYDSSDVPSVGPGTLEFVVFYFGQRMF